MASNILPDCTWPTLFALSALSSFGVASEWSTTFVTARKFALPTLSCVDHALPPLEADELDAVEHGAHAKLARSGLRSHHASIPAVQLAGPLQTIFAIPGTESEHHVLGRGHNFW